MLHLLCVTKCLTLILVITEQEYRIPRISRPFPNKDLKMPKRCRSPRKMNRRNRSLLNCWKCGNTYSYCGSRTHICTEDSDNETHFCQNQKDSDNSEEVSINCHEMDEDMKGTDAELIDFPLSRDIQYNNTASTFKFNTCQFTKLSEAYEVGLIHVERILLVELWANIAVHEVFFLHGT